MRVSDITEDLRVPRVVQWSDPVCLSVNVRAILLYYGKSAPSVEEIYGMIGDNPSNVHGIAGQFGLAATDLDWHQAGEAINWYKWPVLVGIKHSSGANHSYIGVAWSKRWMKLRNPWPMIATFVNGLRGLGGSEGFEKQKFFPTGKYPKAMVVKGCRNVFRCIHPIDPGKEPPSQKWLQKNISSDYGGDGDGDEIPVADQY